MKNTIIPVLVLLSFVAFQCKKNTSEKCVKTKIIRITCASFVLQSLDNDNIGEDGWKNTFENDPQIYDNVFSVTNSCNIASEHKTGDIVYITVNKQGKDTCVRCALYDGAPRTSYFIKTIGSLPCSDKSK